MVESPAHANSDSPPAASLGSGQTNSHSFRPDQSFRTKEERDLQSFRDPRFRASSQKSFRDESFRDDPFRAQPESFHGHSFRGENQSFRSERDSFRTESFRDESFRTSSSQSFRGQDHSARREHESFRSDFRQPSAFYSNPNTPAFNHAKFGRELQSTPSDRNGRHFDDPSYSTLGHDRGLPRPSTTAGISVGPGVPSNNFVQPSPSSSRPTTGNSVQLPPLSSLLTSLHGPGSRYAPGPAARPTTAPTHYAYSRPSTSSGAPLGAGSFAAPAEDSESPFSFNLPPAAGEAGGAGPGVGFGGGRLGSSRGLGEANDYQTQASSAADSYPHAGRKRRFGSVDGPSDTAPPGDDSSSSPFAFGPVSSAHGADYDGGSRPQSRRLSVMELCNDDDAEQQSAPVPHPSVFARRPSTSGRRGSIAASSAPFKPIHEHEPDSAFWGARPVTSGGITRGAEGLVLSDSRPGTGNVDAGRERGTGIFGPAYAFARGAEEVPRRAEETSFGWAGGFERRVSPSGGRFGFGHREGAGDSGAERGGDGGDDTKGGDVYSSTAAAATTATHSAARDVGIRDSADPASPASSGPTTTPPPFQRPSYDPDAGRYAFRAAGNGEPASPGDGASLYLREQPRRSPGSGGGSVSPSARAGGLSPHSRNAGSLSPLARAGPGHGHGGFRRVSLSPSSPPPAPERMTTIPA